MFKIFLSKSCSCENRVKLIFLFSHKSATSNAVLSFSESSGVLIFSEYLEVLSFSTSSISILSYCKLYISIIGNLLVIPLSELKDLFSKSNSSVRFEHLFEFDPKSLILTLFIEIVLGSIRSMALDTKFSKLGERKILIEQKFEFIFSKFWPVEPKELSLLSRSSHANSNFEFYFLKLKVGILQCRAATLFFYQTHFV